MMSSSATPKVTPIDWECLKRACKDPKDNNVKLDFEVIRAIFEHFGVTHVTIEHKASSLFCYGVFGDLRGFRPGATYDEIDSVYGNHRIDEGCLLEVSNEGGEGPLSSLDCEWLSIRYINEKMKESKDDATTSSHKIPSLTALRTSGADSVPEAIKKLKRKKALVAPPTKKSKNEGAFDVSLVAPKAKPMPKPAVAPFALDVDSVSRWIQKINDKTTIKTISSVVSKQFRTIMTEENLKAKNRLAGGTTVTWMSRTKGRQQGVITGFGPKNAMVRATNGSQWRVSPCLLSTA